MHKLSGFWLAGCFLGFQLASSTHAIAADQASISVNFLTQPPSGSISCKLANPPDSESVLKCITAYREDWRRTYDSVKRTQSQLIGKRNAASILQWAGASGVATAAALGISDSDKNKNVAIVVGSASALSAFLGTIWKSEAIEKREQAREYVLDLQPRIESTFVAWEQDVEKPEFRDKFSEKTRSEYFDLVNDNLGKCAPGQKRYQTLR